MESITPFEEFWEEKQDLLLGKVDKETAELIWNSAVVSTIHNVMSLSLEGKL